MKLWKGTSVGIALAVTLAVCLLGTLNAVSGKPVVRERGPLLPSPQMLEVALNGGESLQKDLILENMSAGSEQFTIEEVDLGFKSGAPTLQGTGDWLYRSDGGIMMDGLTGEAGQAYPSAFRWISGQSSKKAVLVYTDDSEGIAPGTVVDQALQYLGWSYTAHYNGDFAGFDADLGSMAWDLVVFANDRWSPPPSTLELLNAHAARGGKLIFQQCPSHWDAANPLWSTLGVSWGEGSLANQYTSLHWWTPLHALFNDPLTVPEASWDYGQSTRLCAQGVGIKDGFVGLAGYDSTIPKPEQTAIVQGNHGRTLFEGFSRFYQVSSDSDADDMADELELWINALVNVGISDVEWLSEEYSSSNIARGESLPLSVRFDAAGLAPGTYEAQLRLHTRSGESSAVPVVMNVQSSEPPSLNLGSVEGSPGQIVSVPITLVPSGQLIASLSTDITFDTNLFENPSAVIGPAGRAAGKTVFSRLVSPGMFRVGAVGINTTPIGPGVVAYLNLLVKSDALPCSSSLQHTPSGSDPSGNLLALTGGSGSVVIKLIHTITAIADSHGTITPSGAVAVNHLEDQAFQIAPQTGYHIAQLMVDGTPLDRPEATYTFPEVTADHTITVSFAIDTYTISASAGNGGTITPSGEVAVEHGSSQSFSIVPGQGYHKSMYW